MRGGFPILYIAEADPAEAVLSSGAMAYLVESIPQAGFTIVGSPESAPLFADTPRLDALIVLERETKMDWFSLWNRVRNRQWSLIVDMRGGSISAKLNRKKRAVRGADPEPMHAVRSAAEVLKLDETPAPRLFFGEETMAAADALIGSDPAPILAVGPGVDWVGKAWPEERYAKIAAPLLGEGGPLEGGRLLIVGTDADRDAAHTIRFAVTRDRVIEAQGKLTPLQTAAALSKARLFLGADSLWTQLAVAAGVPTVAVFGPSDETRTGPWRGRAVRGAKAIDDFRHVDPNLNQAIRHMTDLPVQPVLDAALALLDETAP